MHYVWKHRILPLANLKTTTGEDVEVIDPGRQNTDQGPDFFNAKIRIGGTVWVGNVELHIHATDWVLHGHERDARYNNTVLHVVSMANAEVQTADGKTVPTLVLPIPQRVMLHYNELCATDDYPRCHRLVPQLSPLTVNSWMDSLLAMRLEERGGHIIERLKATGGDWERATFITLSRNFGFGLNGDAFEHWAQLVPLAAAGKHRDNLLQVEALFLGVAGLLDTPSVSHTDEERERMKQEFSFLQHKFSIEHTMTKVEWKFLRTRPQSMPQVRLAQLARLFHEGRIGMSRMMDARDTDELRTLFRTKGLSANSCNLLIINTVVPLLWAYGHNRQEEAMCEKALALLGDLPAEDNFITRQWKACGLNADTAADSQALIELKRNYCDRKDCLRCRFAYDILKIKE